MSTTIRHLREGVADFIGNHKIASVILGVLLLPTAALITDIFLPTDVVTKIWLFLLAMFVYGGAAFHFAGILMSNLIIKNPKFTTNDLDNTNRAILSIATALSAIALVMKNPPVSPTPNIPAPEEIVAVTDIVAALKYRYPDNKLIIGLYISAKRELIK